jgi:hypothetical protein
MASRAASLADKLRDGIAEPSPWYEELSAVLTRSQDIRNDCESKQRKHITIKWIRWCS